MSQEIVDLLHKARREPTTLRDQWSPGLWTDSYFVNLNGDVAMLGVNENGAF